MDYKTVLNAIQDASLFDLYRMNKAIGRELDNPKRIAAVRSRLKPGMKITVFDGDANDLVPARVVKLGQTRLLVQLANGDEWYFYYFAVNVDQRDTTIPSEAGRVGMERNEVRVGQMVGFLDRQNREVFGRVTKLNPRTAAIQVNDGRTWRVDYPLLFPVLDGDSSSAVERPLRRAELDGDGITFDVEPENLVFDVE